MHLIYKEKINPLGTSCLFAKVGRGDEKNQNNVKIVLSFSWERNFSAPSTYKMREFLMKSLFPRAFRSSIRAYVHAPDANCCHHRILDASKAASQGFVQSHVNNFKGLVLNERFYKNNWFSVKTF